MIRGPALAFRDLFWTLQLTLSFYNCEQRKPKLWCEESSSWNRVGKIRGMYWSYVYVCFTGSFIVFEARETSCGAQMGGRVGLQDQRVRHQMPCL